MIYYLLAFAIGIIFPIFLAPLLCGIINTILGVTPKCIVKSKMTKSIAEVILSGVSDYSTTEYTAPVLKGTVFKLFSRFLWTTFGRTYIQPSLLKMNKLHVHRNYFLPEPPTFYPTPPFVPLPANINDVSDVSKEVKFLMESKPLPSPNSPILGHTEKDGFIFPSVSDYVEAYKSGTTTPEEVADRVIAAINTSDAMNPPLRAFVQWNEGEIRLEAKASTLRYKEGSIKGPLDGVPVGVKAEFILHPYLMTHGLSFVSQFSKYLLLTGQESECVVRLKNAGALMIGITNQHELGIGTTGSNVNKKHGTARNPYNSKCYPGGSSSGTAAAVASGLVPLGLGTDGGGSIRIPSSLSGIVGLKATFGRISSKNMCSIAPTLGHPGPMTTCIKDTALGYLLLAGSGNDHPTGLLQGPVTLGDYLNCKDVLKGLKVGVYKDWFEHCDPEVLKGCQAALAYLTEAGADIVDINFPELAKTERAHLFTILIDMITSYQSDLANNFTSFNPESILPMSIGYGLNCSDYLYAQRQRTRAIKIMEHLFNQVQIIATPTTASTAPEIGVGADEHGENDITQAIKLVRFASLTNFTGAPSLAVPVGYDSKNLPISLQLIGPWWREDLLLQVGCVLESYVKKQKPKIFFDILQKISD